MDTPPNGTERFTLDTERVWDLVGRQLDQLATQWNVAETPPELRMLIEELPPSVRRLGLIELIKLDMEHRWSRDMSPWQVEDYMSAFPTLLADTTPPVDLIYEEFHIRRHQGDEPNASEYVRRFPDQAEELCRLLETSSPLLTTSMRPNKIIERVNVGDRLDDFDLLQKLGQGAFAIVFLAHQRSMQRLVAVKVTADKSQEPQTLARLDHPHIVRVYDQRVLPDKSLRLLYMQYVSGGTLQEVLRQMEFHGTSSWKGTKLLDVLDSMLTRQGVEPPSGTAQRQRLGSCDWSSTVCLLGSQIAGALDYAHRQGVLHRDLKPANILLNESASPLLVDFNVSSCSKLDGASPAAYFGGSLAYMSPEQLEACNPRHPRSPESLDGRSDIYALGILLWELLTSQRPFVDHQLPEGWPATVEAMTTRRLAGLQETHWRQLPSHVPHGLQSILRRCLAPAPDDRYSTAGELAAHLRRCLHPEAERVFAPPRGWRALTAHWPMLAMVLTLLTPNALAGIFNFVYNDWAIIQKTPASKPIFESVATFINMTAFPLGVAIGIGLVLPVAREVSQRYRHRTSATSSRAMRRRCLELGNHLSRLSLALWLIAGIAYPIAFWWQDAPLTLYDYLHFFGSLTLCGMIAACYPFFGAFSMIVEVWYPMLCGDSAVPREDIPRLAQLKRTSWRYLLTAILVPMLSTTIIVALNDSDTRSLLIGFSIGSLACFAIVFLLAQRLQGDLTILEEDAEG